MLRQIGTKPLATTKLTQLRYSHDETCILFYSDHQWRHRAESTLPNCWLVAGRHQAITWTKCWFIIKGVLWNSIESNFKGIAHDVNLKSEFEYYTYIIISTSPRPCWSTIGALTNFWFLWLTSLSPDADDARRPDGLVPWRPLLPHAAASRSPDPGCFKVNSQ